jgi:hypothetical protein
MLMPRNAKESGMFRITFIAAPIVCAFALFGSAPQEAHSAPSINFSQPQTAPLVDEVRGGGGRIHMGGGGGRMHMGGGRMHMGGGGGRMHMGGGGRAYHRGSHNFVRGGTISHGRRNLHGARGYDRHRYVNHGRYNRHNVGRHGHGHHSRHFIHRHGRHFVWGTGIGFWFYDGYYYGNCAWLRQRAIATGSSYWWDRYNSCRYY